MSGPRVIPAVIHGSLRARPGDPPIDVRGSFLMGRYVGDLSSCWKGFVWVKAVGRDGTPREMLLAMTVGNYWSVDGSIKAGAVVAVRRTADDTTQSVYRTDVIPDHEPVGCLVGDWLDVGQELEFRYCPPPPSGY